MSGEDKQMTKLVDLALDVLEDELACWRRIGTHMSKVTRLVRYPQVMNGPPMYDAEIEALGEMELQYLDVPDSEVNPILRRIAMEKVVKALAKEILI